MAALSPAALILGGSVRHSSESGDRASRLLTRGALGAGLALVVVLAVLVSVLIGRPMELAGLPLQVAGRTWRPGQAFDLVAARQVVSGSEIVAGSYGRANRFRAVTAVGGLVALVLFALR